MSQQTILVEEKHRPEGTIQHSQKFCPRCKNWKPTGEYNKNSSKKDGLQTECRECKRIMRAKDRNHDRARVAVRKAVLEGKLPKVSSCVCIKCGQEAQEWHHTKGYAPENWLDVEAVCRSCHRKIERRIQKNKRETKQTKLF